jgi:hypothetical protein
MKKFALVAAALVLAANLAANLEARPQYNKEFTEVVKANPALAKAQDSKSNCNLCHQGIKSKKNHNEFGHAIIKVLKTKNEKDVATIKKAFDDAAKEKVPGQDGKTFGDLIKDGTLPVTKEEPAQ